MKRRNLFAVHGLDAHDRVSRCFCALIGVAGMVAFGAVETTDFVCDGNGNTNLWELSSTEADLYGRKFSENDDAITSPVYGGAVVSVGVSARMFSTGNGSALRMEARPSDIENWRVVHRLVFLNNAVTNETFSLSRADDFRQFRLVFERGVGTMRVGSFKAVWRADGEVAVPHSLAVSEVTESSFIANWVVDEPVDRFLFDCYRESMTSWTGQAKWAEMFVRCVNANKVPKKLTADTFDSYTDLPGWSGDFVYAPSGADGVIQVGKAEKGEGWFISPELPAMEEVELVVRARAFAEQPDHSMPVFLIRGANTNAVESFELSTSFSDCHCAIPEILAGDRLAFRSFSVG